MYLSDFILLIYIINSNILDVKIDLFNLIYLTQNQLIVWAKHSASLRGWYQLRIKGGGVGWVLARQEFKRGMGLEYGQIW